MLPDSIRVHGLRVALTVKHVQDDLVIVDDFDSLVSPDPQVFKFITKIFYGNIIE